MELWQQLLSDFNERLQVVQSGSIPELCIFGSLLFVGPLKPTDVMIIPFIHKSILGSPIAGPYFAAMLAHPMKEISSGEIEVTDVGHSVLREIL